MRGSAARSFNVTDSGTNSVMLTSIGRSSFAADAGAYSGRVPDVGNPTGEITFSASILHP
jgi:hypothetical protein